jgi:hypothetical protein
MLTLLGSLLGFISSAFPDLLKIWAPRSAALFNKLSNSSFGTTTMPFSFSLGGAIYNLLKWSLFAIHGTATYRMSYT